MDGIVLNGLRWATSRGSAHSVIFERHWKEQGGEASEGLEKQIAETAEDPPLHRHDKSQEQ